MGSIAKSEVNCPRLLAYGHGIFRHYAGILPEQVRVQDATDFSFRKRACFMPTYWADDFEACCSGISYARHFGSSSAHYRALQLRWPLKANGPRVGTKSK